MTDNLKETFSNSLTIPLEAILLTNWSIPIPFPILRIALDSLSATKCPICQRVPGDNNWITESWDNHFLMRIIHKGCGTSWDSFLIEDYPKPTKYPVPQVSLAALRTTAERYLLREKGSDNIIEIV